MSAIVEDDPGARVRAPSRAPIPSRPATPGISRRARIRAWVVGAGVVLGLAGVAHRAWTLQVDDGERFRALAEKQHMTYVDSPAPRGDVLDTRGRALAVSGDAESVWANPHEIRDVTSTAEKLAAILGEDAATLEARLGGDRRFVWVDRHVTPEVAQKVRAAKLAGVEVVVEPRRWYPGGAIGGPVIGRADVDGNGREGIELAMNATLTGVRGSAVALRDAKGRRMYTEGFAQPSPGATVTLTLDRSLQAIAEAAVADSVETHHAKSGVAVVIDVATSHVLAMASYPTYDPNGGETARNLAVTDTFEAGSVMKTFSIASALDAGTVTPDTEFDLRPGWIVVGGKTITDTHRDDKYLSTTGIMKHSSNVGAVLIAQMLGREKLYAGLRRFGFGAKTGIELPGERAGTLRNGTTWRDSELATISYGLGLTVTPLQIAAALAAIGNQGQYRAPRIIERVVDAEGKTVPRPEPPVTQAISPATAEQMRKILAAVFFGGYQAGSAATIVVPGYRCGGKTGTAHKWDAEAHQYASDRHLSSFAGLAPIDNPRLAIVVLVDEPSGEDYFGAKVAGPVFARIASESLRYLGVPGGPTECAPEPKGEPKPKPDPFASIPPKTCLPPAEPKPAVDDAAPPPAPRVAVPAGAVPDFAGMSVAHALDVARGAHLTITVSGSGRVVAQDPAPGARGERVSLTFSDGVLTVPPSP